MRRKYENINEPNPYAKGRWYRVFLESDGTSARMVECDLEGTEFGSNTLFAPYNFNVVDYLVDLHGVRSGSAYITNHIHSVSAVGRIQMTTTNPKGWDWMYVYIFGYYTE